jgi:hypothetical protein
MNKVLRNTAWVVLLAIAVACGLAGTNDARAASGGLTVSPTSSDIEIAPGASKKGEMLVVNQGELDMKYKVYVTPYSVTGEDYQPYFQPIDGATDITKWFTFSTTEDAVKVGEQDTISYNIAVPKGTGAGSYYATVFVETEDKGSTGVITRKRIGMIVYLRVSGSAVEKGSINSWNVSWLQEAPFKANVKIANEGSVHFASKVRLVVSDLFGSEKFSYERSPTIIPQKIRDVPIEWQNGATFGFFKVDAEVNYLGKTEHMPSKYVFIANTSMRIVTVGIFLAFVGIVVFLGRKRVATRKK